jgi:Pectate lyase superfamily protein
MGQILFNTTAGAATTAPALGIALNTMFAEVYAGRLSVTDAPYNADPAGVIDSTAAINAADVAATAAGQALYFPAGTYRVSVGAAGTRLVMNGCSWLGAGRNASIIKSAAGAYPAASNLVMCSGKSNLSISRLGFDMSFVTFPSGTTCRHIVMLSCTNWEIFDCAFTGIQTYNLAVYPNGGDLWAIKDCYFSQLTPSINQSQAINVQQSSGRHEICRNICIGCGIFSGGNDGLYEGNLVYGWGFGGGIVIGPNSTSQNNRVIGNTCCSAGIATGYLPDINGTYMSGIEIWSPNSIVIGNNCSGNCGAGITIGGANTVVNGNTCMNNSQGTFAQPGILMQGNGALTSTASNCVVTGNVCTDTQGTPTQTYGYLEAVENTGTITGNVVSGNSIYGNKTGQYSFASTTPGDSINAGQVKASNSFSIPAGGAQPVSFSATSTPHFGVFFGSGVPTLSAAQGSLYLRSDGASNVTRMYVNNSAGSGTTWTAVNTVA